MDGWCVQWWWCIHEKKKTCYRCGPTNQQSHCYTAKLRQPWLTCWKATHLIQKEQASSAHQLNGMRASLCRRKKSIYYKTILCVLKFQNPSLMSKYFFHQQHLLKCYWQQCSAAEELKLNYIYGWVYFPASTNAIIWTPCASPFGGIPGWCPCWETYSPHKAQWRDYIAQL